MRAKKVAIEDIKRFNPSFKEGLNDEQVNSRIEQGLVNKTKMIAGKTYWEIIRTNVLSFFNIMLFFLAGFIMYANINDGLEQTKWYTGLFFVLILLSNIILGLYQDLKAKHLMNKLKVITTPMSRVIRNGQVIEIKPSEIVLDDILEIHAGEQVPSDCILLENLVSVNESMLTGESRNVDKNIGDMLYSGSYITTGNCFAKVEKVGKENYIETLTEKAKAFKRNPSHILRSLKILFRYLGIIIIGVFVVTNAAYAAVGRYSTWHDFILMIRPVAGQMVAMVPAGLYLLTSLALASGVLSLYRKRANVQDFYSIEMLARSDVICVDKTGTITDGNLSVTKIENLSKLSESEIAKIIHSIVSGTKDENVTAKALKEYFKEAEVFDVDIALPFNSDNKYSGVTLKTSGTYLIGALEYMNVKNKEQLIKQSEEYTSKGFRLLALAKGKEKIVDKSYKANVEIVAFIVLQDHVKDDAKETFAWFQNNHVQVKVISGDNALTVSEVARVAGIDGAEKYVSLEGKSLEEVRELANDYVVFGRVTPEQKEALILVLKENKHTVAMVGDGVNDMLALKRADCSIAMNSGSLSARNVSHVVLMDDNFATMPSVVAEGRRVINNLERTGSLFLTKTSFAITLSFVFLIISLSSKGLYAYPYSTNNMMLWEVFGIGLVSFFIALEPDSKPIKPGFLRNILIKAIPSAVLICFSVFVCYMLYILQSHGVIYVGFSDLGLTIEELASPRIGVTAISVLVFSLLSVFVLFMTCRPLNLYRGIVVGSSALVTILVILIFALKGGENILGINFDKLNWEYYFVGLIIAFTLAAVYLLVYTLIQNHIKFKGEVKNED